MLADLILFVFGALVGAAVLFGVQVYRDIDGLPDAPAGRTYDHGWAEGYAIGVETEAAKHTEVRRQAGIKAAATAKQRREGALL